MDTDCDFSEIIEFYAADLEERQSWESELLRWKALWSRKSESERPKSIMATLAHPDVTAEYYPSIFELLVILFVLPASVARCERSFSTLKRLKTYLRACCVQHRVVGLALLNIHLDIEVTAEEIAEVFMSADHRRIIKG